VADLHRRYLAELAVAAGQVTGGERYDLVAVAALLALTPSDVDSALAAAGGSPHPGRGRFRLERGDVVVFTGETTVAREVWEERARAAGLVVGPRVTKATRLVVAADPDTMSGKADLARRYGVPVVHPAGFEALLAALGPAGGSGPGRPPA
jgi:DNA polymerase III subunit epsilon